MSRRNPSLGEMLVLLPWQVSAGLAAIAFVGLRWVIPSLHFENPILATFAKATGGLAWLALLGLGTISLLSALFARRKKALLEEQRDADSLRALSWQELEWLVGEAYRRKDYAVEESLSGGSDGGIDLILRKDGRTLLVQCKRWKTQSVGAPVIREMFGLLGHHGADGVIIVTSGGFTRDAMSFAEGKPIELIDGKALLALVRGVQRQLKDTVPPIPNAPETKAVESASKLAPPHCPSCQARMVKRTARRGANSGNTFWGCSNYPTCRGVRPS